MFACRACCAEPAASLEQPPRAAHAERVSPLEDGDARPRQDAGTFEDNAGAEVFGRQVAAPSKGEQGLPQPLHAPSRAFTARVEFPEGRGLGVCLDATPEDLLRISKIGKSSPIAGYNQRAEQHLRVVEGDYITSVNGRASSPKAKVMTMNAGGLVELQIRRAHTFDVKGLDTSQGKLGLDLTFHDKGRAAYIKEVFSDGLVHACNSASPGHEVRSGDLVIAVNARMGTARELLDLIGRGGKLDLTISRPDIR
mmetsp:Transcript_38826/g.110053  ORF Transcript_38826/g.110053 Transcript_38826/m.110053 type:complete len:253 (+) Transcript_38826:70-828(+)